MSKVVRHYIYWHWIVGIIAGLIAILLLLMFVNHWLTAGAEPTIRTGIVRWLCGQKTINWKYNGE